ncbi:MAG: 5-formyltetrahydrofolate cyclo-ligase [Sandaracinaceae bacterium]
MIRTPSDEEVAFLRVAVKSEIRDRRKRTRKALPREARWARSASICERVVGLPEWERAKTVLAFVSMVKEVQTKAAIENAWAAGKRVAVPRMNADFDGLELRELSADTELEESGMMFLQPPEDAPTVADEDIDLVLVPALAVDERGHRVGYGKGLYDGLLPRLKRALRVAVVFDFERIAEVPDRDADERVDVVITDARIDRCPPRS